MKERKSNWIVALIGEFAKSVFSSDRRIILSTHQWRTEEESVAVAYDNMRNRGGSIIGKHTMEVWPQAEQWKPIESAPNGFILLWSEGDNVSIGRFEAETGTYRDNHDDPLPHPTHWMKLPSPPK